MNDKNYKSLLQFSKSKVDNTFALVEASLKKLNQYDSNKNYSYDELEPYDALADRFIRCVEMFSKYFKTYDTYQSINPALTFRDLINTMEKLSIVSNTPIWMDMKDVRNRIVHDYIPEQTKAMFDNIMNEFYTELKFSKQKIDDLDE